MQMPRPKVPKAPKGVMSYAAALKVWNGHRKQIDPSHVWALPRKGTPEHTMVLSIKSGDYQIKHDAVVAARAKAKTMAPKDAAPAVPTTVNPILAKTPGKMRRTMAPYRGRSAARRASVRARSPSDLGARLTAAVPPPVPAPAPMAPQNPMVKRGRGRPKGHKNIARDVMEVPSRDALEGMTLRQVLEIVKSRKMKRTTGKSKAELINMLAPGATGHVEAAAAGQAAMPGEDNASNAVTMTREYHDFTRPEKHDLVSGPGNKEEMAPLREPVRRERVARLADGGFMLGLPDMMERPATHKDVVHMLETFEQGRRKAAQLEELKMLIDRIGPTG